MLANYAEFWVCANPEEVTRLLRLEPTSTRIKQPYDYWQYECFSEDFAEECFVALLEVMKSRAAEIIEAASKFAVGVNLVSVIRPRGSFVDNNFVVEVHEMEFLARLNVPLCVSFMHDSLPP